MCRRKQGELDDRVPPLLFVEDGRLGVVQTINLETLDTFENIIKLHRDSKTKRMESRHNFLPGGHSHRNTLLLTLRMIVQNKKLGEKMTAPRMQHYPLRRHTLAKNRYTVSDLVTSELTQG